MPVLIDQGTDDEFLAEQLFAEDLKFAYEEKAVQCTLCKQEGYDHRYHFITTFIGSTLACHAKALQGQK